MIFICFLFSFSLYAFGLFILIFFFILLWDLAFSLAFILSFEFFGDFRWLFIFFSFIFF